MDDQGKAIQEHVKSDILIDLLGVTIWTLNSWRKQGCPGPVRRYWPVRDICEWVCANVRSRTAGVAQEILQQLGPAPARSRTDERGGGVDVNPGNAGESGRQSTGKVTSSGGSDRGMARKHPGRTKKRRANDGGSRTKSPSTAGSEAAGSKANSDGNKRKIAGGRGNSGKTGKSDPGKRRASVRNAATESERHDDADASDRHIPGAMDCNADAGGGRKRAAGAVAGAKQGKPGKRKVAGQHKKRSSVGGAKAKGKAAAGASESESVNGVDESAVRSRHRRRGADGQNSPPGSPAGTEQDGSGSPGSAGRDESGSRSAAGRESGTDDDITMPLGLKAAVDRLRKYEGELAQRFEDELTVNRQSALLWQYFKDWHSAVDLMRKSESDLLKVLQETKALLPADYVRTWIVQRMDAAKSRLLSLPSKIAPQLEGLGWIEIQEMLKKELLDAIGDLSGKSLGSTGDE